MTNSSKWQTREFTETFLNDVHGAIPGADMQLTVIGKVLDLWMPAPEQSWTLDAGSVKIKKLI